MVHFWKNIYYLVIRFLTVNNETCDKGGLQGKRRNTGEEEKAAAPLDDKDGRERFSSVREITGAKAERFLQTKKS